MQAGNYSEADGKIVEAFQKLKDAVRIVDETVPEQQTETEINLERTFQLKSSISRYTEQLQRIENLTRFAASVGYNTTTLEDKISTIKDLLETASKNIEQQRFEAAQENLAEAKNLSDRILNTINSFAADLKITRIATYINQTQQRLDAIRETAKAASNEASLAAVDNAETSLNNAKTYLEEQRINETLSELANSKASEDAAVEYLRPTASAVDATANTAPTAAVSP
jgi:DNA repair exonuclease SbcCD ATPase subunit